jgi:hypothetical protein
MSCDERVGHCLAGALQLARQQQNQPLINEIVDFCQEWDWDLAEFAHYQVDPDQIIADELTFNDLARANVAAEECHSQAMPMEQILLDLLQNLEQKRKQSRV